MDKLLRLKECAKDILLELLRDELKEWNYTNTYGENSKFVRDFLQSMYNNFSTMTYDDIVYGEISDGTEQD